MPADGMIHNASVATFDPNIDGEYGLVRNATVSWKRGIVTAVVADGDPGAGAAHHSIDAEGRLLTPGFVDCHTHLVYGGDRAGEFAWRLQGQSYEAIARRGGGIMSTVKATRDADFDTLYRGAKQRLDRLFRSGVTTVEIKSGYGLTVAKEIELLQVIKKLKADLPLHIHATCLAAHTVPGDFAGSGDDYIAMLCEELLPEVKRQQLADSVDVFCETIAFSAAQARRLFARARELGLPVRGHVEQLSQSHGTDAVCEFSGLSADHLEYADEQQVIKMQRAGSVAVLLPGAYYYLHESRQPPLAALRKHGVPMAVATDLNPGTSPLYSITTAANMACVLFSLTPEEALCGITRHGARALDVGDRKGRIAPGADADMLLWPLHSPVSLVYEVPAAEPVAIWVGGSLRESLP